jgi:hypothetical protein
MVSEPGRSALLFVAALTGGAMNAVAGGGSLLTFSALIFAGISPLTANATSALALLPGSLASLWSYRGELRAKEPLVPILVLCGIAGGFLGAWLLLATGEARFARLVPWLVGAATLLFALQGRIQRFALGHDRPLTTGALAGVAVFQLIVSTYGGFFGAAMGILMLAAFGFVGVRPIHRINGLKHVAAFATNAVAAGYFIVEKRIAFREAALMALGAVAGGWTGAQLAQKSSHRGVERAVVIIGVALTVVLAWRVLAGG